jgi:hypothetical protein
MSSYASELTDCDVSILAIAMPHVLYRRRHAAEHQARIGKVQSPLGERPVALGHTQTRRSGNVRQLKAPTGE